MADEQTGMSVADSEIEKQVDDGRWQACDGHWYAASDHPDAAHRAKWAGPSYRPFGAGVTADELPVIAVQPPPRADDRADVPTRSAGRRALAALIIVAALVASGVILAELLG